jgi:hypothetical protein
LKEDIAHHQGDGVKKDALTVTLPRADDDYAIRSSSSIVAIRHCLPAFCREGSFSRHRALDLNLKFELDM